MRKRSTILAIMFAVLAPLAIAACSTPQQPVFSNPPQLHKPASTQK